MQHRPAHSPIDLPPALRPSLEAWRQARDVEPATLLEAKTQALMAYMRRHRITAAVVGVSGGIDSALVVAMLAHLAKQPQSPLRLIVPLCLPCSHHNGVSGQEQALARAHQAVAPWGLELKVVDMASMMDIFHTTLESALKIPGDDWARGQAVAYARTPLLYATTSLLTSQGHRAVVVGTTNFDEGAWLGYVGKASDGMVDIQPISDLYKHQVRALAQHLGVDRAVLTATPTGDMWDGAPDEHVFGTTYDMLEWVGRWRSQPTHAQRRALWATLDHPTRRTILSAWTALKALHRANAHKYLVGSPAVHMDIMPNTTPKGSTPAQRGGVPQATLQTPFSPPPAGYVLGSTTNNQAAPHPLPTEPDPTWLATSLPTPMVLSRNVQGHPITNEQIIHTRAAALAQAKGHRVAACYVSPSHDSYVSTKPHNAHQWPAPRRFEHILQTIGQIDKPTILLDMWEACAPRQAINFTDVLDHIECCHEQTTGIRPRAVAVFGADNAGFADAFVGHGTAIVINRPGYQDRFDQAQALLGDAPHVWWDEHANMDVSSTKVRQQKFRGWLLRDDEETATARWTSLVPPHVLHHAWEQWKTTLIQALNTAAPSMVLHVTHLQEQRQELEAWLQDKDNIIVLDPCLAQWCQERHKGAVHWPISRLFHASTAQHHPWAHRVDKMPEQVRRQPQGPWWLLDDDTVTGRTFDAITLRLPADTVQGRMTLARLVQAPTDLDPIDARDFLPGSNKGGLVVEHGRVPYLWPLVNLTQRASIPSDRQPMFSHTMWKAAATFYTTIPATFAHTDPDCQHWWLRLGLSMDTPLAQWCHDQARSLESVIK